MGHAPRAERQRDQTAPPVIIGHWDGQYQTLGGFEHVALLAKTGSGKTTSFTIPNALEWPGSLVVLDIKGEVYAATAGYRSQVLHQPVYCFNPTAHDNRSHTWNPLDAVDRTSPDRFDQIMNQANLLIPDPVDATGSGNSIFWQRAARMALSAVIELLAEIPEEPLTYRNVLAKFLRGDGLQWLHHAVSSRRHRLSQDVVEGISNYIGRGERLTEDIRFSVATNLLVFRNPNVAAATQRSDFDFRQLRRTPTTLYVTVSPADISRVEHLLRLLFGSLINFNTRVTPEQDPTLATPVLIILDEFARLGAMPALTSAAQFARGFGIRMAYIVQDKYQLEALYGRAGAADVWNNLGTEVIFGLGDIRQAEEYEKRLGNQTIDVRTRSTPRIFPAMNMRAHRLNQNFQPRPLMFAFEIASMPQDQALVIRPNMQGVLGERVRYFTDAEYRRRAAIPAPEVPPLPVSIKLDDGSIQLPAIAPTPNRDQAPPWLLAKAIPKAPEKAPPARENVFPLFRAPAESGP